MCVDVKEVGQLKLPWLISEAFHSRVQLLELKGEGM